MNKQNFLSSFSLLTEDERYQLIDEWSGKVGFFPADQSIVSLFEQQVKQRGEAVALVEDHGFVTYGQLNARANSLARWLRSCGLGQDRLRGEDRFRPSGRALAAICLDRSVDMIVAVLGVLKAGAAYVPLDASYPEQRLSYMLKDTGAAVLISHSSLDHLFEGVGEQVHRVRMDEEQGLWQQELQENLGIRIEGEDLAYVIYTSGSTGQPKGVMIEHKGLCNLAYSQSQAFGITEHSHLLQFASPGFDASVSEWSTVLSQGGRLYVLPGTSEQPVSERLVAALERYPIDIVTLPPSLVAALPDSCLSSLRTLVVAGEACPAAVVSKWHKRLRLLNAYGPTEATVCASIFECDEAHPAATIGKPLSNVQLYLLDKYLQPVAVGTVGEIYLGGVGLARGYLHEEQLTVQHFIDHPFKTGERLYRTGDRARYLSDGNIEYIGRQDHQVKLRGYRIELGEVEAVVEQSGYVEQAVVMAEEEHAGQRQLVAYITGNKGDKVTEEELIRAVQEHTAVQLPAYMVPSSFVVIEAFPITQNGKVDRAALPAMRRRRMAEQSASLPRAGIEEQLAQIWRTVLGVEKVGRDQSFFELGGDSILCIQMVAQANAEGLSVQIRDVFESPAIAQLAHLLNTQLKAQTTSSNAPLIGHQLRDKDIPLSFAQQRLWFLDRILPDGSVYNALLGLRLQGTLHVDALHQALQHIVDRHEILRTGLKVKDGQPYQVIEQHLPLSMEQLDLEELPPSEREVAIENQAYREARRAFALEQAPLLRVQLLHIAEQDHVLLITMHHLVSDAWSIQVFSHELDLFYTALKEGRLPGLPALAVQYADFALWQRQWLDEQRMEAQLAYWKSHLGNVPQLIDWPMSRVRPEVQSYRGAYYRFKVDGSLRNQLQALSTSRDTTLFTLVLAALGVLLHRYTGENDIVIGTPTANRHYAGTQELLGFFVNTLALHLNFSGNPGFSDLLEQAKLAVIQGHAHQDVPFEQVVEALGVQRSLSWHPVFQVMFGLQRMERQPALAELQTTPLWTDMKISRFDLTVSAEDSPEGLMVGFEYATDLFDEAAMARMAEHMQELLRGIAADAHTRIGSLPLLTERERQRMLVEWNSTEVAYPAGQSIVSLFEQQVEQHGEAVALVEHHGSLTYGQLNARANRLARWLRSCGLGQDRLRGEDRFRPSGRALAAICLDRSVDMIVAVLGVLKAGAAYVPLDASYPEQRLSYMLKDTGAAVLISHSSLDHLFEGVGEQVHRVRMDEEQGLWQQELQENLGIRIEGEDLAYVIYTSGSTGQPKGVMIQHKGLYNLAYTESWVLKINSGSHVLQFASFSFDAVAWEWSAVLSQGGTLYVLPGTSEQPVSERLVAALERYPIDIVTLPPSLVAALPDSCLSSLRTLVVAGEACPAAVVSKWHKRLRLLNAYGPTEATVCASIFECDEAHPAATIGKPLSNVQLYLLDKYLQPVAVGTVGEIYLGGVGLARGYLHEEQLTVQHFIDHPFKTGERLYRTGDRARYLSDGNIEYIGRQDHQVKLRGYRIELGEVEAVVEQSGYVEQAVVMAEEEHAGQRQLVAYITGNKGDKVTEEELIRAVQEHTAVQLPAYMVPSSFVVIEAFPITQNGKVDRAALPAMRRRRMAEQSASLPRAGIEEQLAQIWRTVLGVEKVGRDQSFFELGGDSILCIQMVAQANAEGLSVQIRDVFESPAIAQLAHLLNTQLKAQTTSSNAPLIGHQLRDKDIPLSFAQQRLWFLDRILPDGSVYNALLGLRLQGTLHVDALHQALQHIVDRHEILRTGLKVKDGQPYQVIEQHLPLSMEQLDLEELPPSEREVAIENQAYREARRAFALEQAPLLRVQLLHIAEQDHVLLITMHHLVSDAWSIQVFSHELDLFYTALKEGRLPGLPALAVQYADFALWQRQWLDEQRMEAQLAYWKSHLGNVPQLIDWPMSRVRPEVQSYRGAYYRFKVDGSLRNQLQALSTSRDTTLFTLVLAALGVLLHRYTGENDIVIGTPTANRHYAGTQELLGFFVNTLALHLNFSGNPGFSDLLEQAKLAVIQGHAHQDVPFEQVVEALGVQRSLSWHPVFQVMFGLQRMERQPALAELQTTPLWTDMKISRFDLTVSAEDSPEGLMVGFEYATDLFDEAAMARMAEHMQELLRGIAADAHTRIGSLPLLTERERQRMLVEWNSTEVAYPAGQSIVSLFEQQVEQHGEAVALVEHHGSLTYGQLNARANRLARWLRSCGLGQDRLRGEDRFRPSGRALAAICLDRSVDMIVAVLGVLKAGAAYVPLDASYPEQRLSYMLKDTGAAVLISHSSLDHLFEGVGEQVHRVRMDEEQGLWQQELQENLGIRIEGEDLAYVIYTSGSTGQPKGVMIQHKGLVNYLEWCRNYYNFKAGEGIPLIGSFAFDLSVTSLFLPLISGGYIFLAREKENTPVLLSVLKEDSTPYGLIKLTPSHLTLLKNEQLSDSILHKTKALVLGGEKLTAETADLWGSASPHTIIYNEYGPTETTVACCAYQVNLAETKTGNVPIGKPIANSQLYILDSYKNPSPVNIPGELYIGGAGVARGYLKNEVMTNERFIQNPFNNDPQDKIYRTGDVARFFPDGTIEYINRTDNQIKIRGFRIEPAEVELALMQHEQVKQAIVLTVTGSFQYKQLVAYIILKSTYSNDEKPEWQKTLSDYLSARLPSYMIPEFFIAIDEIPLTTNGKLDRAALPAPGSRIKKENEKESGKPKNEIERQLVGIWKEVLQVDEISVNDNFFHLGGHSMLVTEAVLRMNDLLDVEMPLRHFFEKPTIAHLAQLITNRQFTSRLDLKAQGLFADALLPEDVHPVNGSAVSVFKGHLLLTGATGFLGAHLLSDLLRKTKSKIYCIVRSRDRQDAFQKITANLKKYRLDDQVDYNRIYAFTGDLSLPQLGLEDAEYRYLADNIDAIFHNGAYVHHIYNYEVLRSSNVESTLEILRLATSNKLKHVYYISTLAAAIDAGDLSSIKEAFIKTDLPSPFAGGYAQTKWASEKLLAQANDRGIPVTIFRPASITGHSKTGNFSFENDHLWRMIKGCIQMGAAPDWNMKIDMVPVDVVSCLITETAVNMNAAGQVMNVSNPDSMSWQELIEWFNEEGYTLKLLPPEEWREHHLSKINTGNALYPLLSIYLREDKELAETIHEIQTLPVQRSKTLSVINQLNLDFPAVDKNTMRIYTSFLLSRNFFPDLNLTEVIK